MPKAKKTTKKPIETVILPVIYAGIPESNAEKISALMSLQATAGWAMILQILTENKEYLERLILSAIDPVSGDKLTPQEQDEARYKLGLTKELMDTPRKVIEDLSKTKAGPVEFDPYYQTRADMDRDKT